MCCSLRPGLILALINTFLLYSLFLGTRKSLGAEEQESGSEAVNYIVMTGNVYKKRVSHSLLSRHAFKAVPSPGLRGRFITCHSLTLGPRVTIRSLEASLRTSIRKPICKPQQEAKDRGEYVDIHPAGYNVSITDILAKYKSRKTAN